MKRYTERTESIIHALAYSNDLLLLISFFQINVITSYMDGSQVYGSSEEVSRILRSPKGHGLLDVVPLRNVGDRPRLPDAAEEAFCRSPNPEEKPCFLAGDIRVNENQGRKSRKKIQNNLNILKKLEIASY